MKTALFAWGEILKSPAVDRQSIRAAIKAMDRGVIARRAYVSRTLARCLMSLILPTVRSRYDRHAVLRRLDPIRGDLLVTLSNFLVVFWDSTVRWPREKQRELERALVAACRAELRRRSEINREAVACHSGLSEVCMVGASEVGAF